jgi:hypothetical protein
VGRGRGPFIFYQVVLETNTLGPRTGVLIFIPDAQETSKIGTVAVDHFFYTICTRDLHMGTEDEGYEFLPDAPETNT